MELRATAKWHAPCSHPASPSIADKPDMLTFFMTPGSCSTGIHLLLERLEVPFQVTVLNLPARDHRHPDYLALNPKGTIPALQRDDGRVLTEFGAIAFWLARQYPRAGLLPEDAAEAAAVLARLDHAVGTVHGQGWTRVFTPEAYLPPGLDTAETARWIPALQAQGRDLVQQGLEVIDAQLAGDPLPRPLNIADAALFYVEFWAEHTGLPLPPRCAAHLAWMRSLPYVQQVLREEGYRV